MILTSLACALRNFFEKLLTNRGFAKQTPVTLAEVIPVSPARLSLCLGAHWTAVTYAPRYSSLTFQSLGSFWSAMNSVTRRTLEKVKTPTSICVNYSFNNKITKRQHNCMCQSWKTHKRTPQSNKKSLSPIFIANLISRLIVLKRKNIHKAGGN